MPLPTSAALSALGGSYQSPYLSERQRKSILLLAKISELKVKGGTNYDGNHKQLFQDAETSLKGIPRGQFLAIETGLVVAVAVAQAASTISATVNAQLAQVRLTQTRPDEEIDRALLLMEYLLQQANGS